MPQVIAEGSPGDAGLAAGLARLFADNDHRLQEEGAVFISYEELQAASNDEVDVSLMGHERHGERGYSAVLVKSDRETKSLAYARRNAAEEVRALKEELKEQRSMESALRAHADGQDRALEALRSERDELASQIEAVQLVNRQLRSASASLSSRPTCAPR